MKFLCFLALLSVFAMVAFAAQDLKCGANEHIDCWRREPTCSNPHGICQGSCYACANGSKCICTYPYVRNNGKCTKYSECRKH
ncbi:hypothetical protein QR680_016185 [Steinernema hermaphroditum]|uniref:TIL domain-containing protein n=1 Tax=Steinernema hermaphroditum TaxID=289476 RepID=A0AA39LM55_9BILA|nr:hypothetical protein QR680_016185 [Steinernema hermaphroditum]